MEKSQRNHVVITGVGRSGTTFLMQLLTHLGLPTGYTSEELEKHIDKNANAGLERNLRAKSALPYIVKDPIMCNYVEDIVESKEIKLDHVYVPMRKLEDAAKSRVKISEKSGFKPAKGGMWKTGKPENQANVLATTLYGLLVGLSKMEVPVTYLHFPTIVQNPKYLYEKLEFLVKDIDYDHFEEVFNQVANPEMTFSK